MNTFSWSSTLLGAAPFLAVLILKLLIDLRLAPTLVRYFHWLPLRNYFREKPPQLRGTWEHTWAAGGSVRYESATDRHGHSELRQLGSYIYAEFYSQAKRYAFFGQIKNGHVVGDWFDVRDPAGYFGVFQLEIVNSTELRGIWLGHSKEKRTIRSDASIWKRMNA
jgi:hypothetical protein